MDFWSHGERKEGGCLEWQRATQKDGYGTLRAAGKTWLAHRYAYHLTHGSIPEGAYILHHCDNPCCINPRHLYAGTQRDNMRDMKERGRHRKPSDPWANAKGRHKLTADQVRDIRKRLHNGEFQREIAEDYEVSQGTITNIKRGVCYAHVF